MSDSDVNLSQYVTGQGTLSGSMLNTFSQTCDTIAQLRGFVGLSNIQVYVRGNTAPNDGGQGAFYWNATSTAADNGVSVIAPTSVAGAGRWIRLSTDGTPLGPNPPSGPAGGDLTGTYPNPAIAALAVTTGKIAAEAVTTAKIVTGAITTALLAVNAVTNGTLAQMPANTVKANLTGALANAQDVPVATLFASSGGGGGGGGLAANAFGVPQQGIIFTLTGGAYSRINSFPALAAGPTASRTSTGLVSVVLGTTALNMGFYLSSANFVGGGSGEAGLCSAIGTMAASGTYTFNIQHASSKTYYDADQVMILFY